MIDRDAVVVPNKTRSVWQEIVNILADLLSIPAGLIMQLQGPRIQVFAASESAGNPYHPGDSEVFEGSGLYCETVVNTQDRLLVPNALQDEHWKDNPDVKLHMISYLGFPITYPDGTPFGTICVLDKKTNAYSKRIESLMQQFRHLIESDLEMIYMNSLLHEDHQSFTAFAHDIQALRGVVPICSNCKSIRDQKGQWHPVEEMIDSHAHLRFSHSLCPHCQSLLYPDLS